MNSRVDGELSLETVETLETLRSFIAVEPDADVKDWFRSLRDVLSADYRGIRWVTPENFHLTLRFLGQLEPDRISIVLETMRSVIRKETPFSLQLGSSGVFGSARNPRVFWLSLESGGSLERLTELQSRLETGLEAVGFSAEDRPWSPHLTVGRRRNLRKPAQTEGWDELVEHSMAEHGELKLSVDKWTLFSSALTPEGPHYDVLGVEALGQETLGR